MLIIRGKLKFPAKFKNTMKKRISKNTINDRLEYLRQEIKAERISYGEIIELQSLKDYIDSNDIELLQWAGVIDQTT